MTTSTESCLEAVDPDRVPIPDVTVHRLTAHVDGRGSVTEIFRSSWGVAMHQWTVLTLGTRVVRGPSVHRTHSDAVIALSGVLQIGLRDLAIIGRPAVVVDLSTEALAAAAPLARATSRSLDIDEDVAGVIIATPATDHVATIERVARHGRQPGAPARRRNHRAARLTSKMPLPPVLLVGCGRWGRNILRDLAIIGRPAVVVDPSTEALAAAAPLARATSRSLDIDEDVAGVIIATPATDHVATIERVARMSPRSSA